MFHPDHKPVLLRTCTSLAVFYGLSIIVDLILLVGVQKAQTQLIFAGIGWILFHILVLLVCVFYVEQNTAVVILILATLGIQLWSLLIYVGALQEWKSMEEVENIELSSEF